LRITAQIGLKEKVQSLLERANAIRVSDLLQSIKWSEEALELSRRANDEALIAHSLSKLSLFYMITGQNDRCTEAALEAIGVYQRLGDERGIADAKYSLAGTYYKTDQFYLGLIYLGECLTTYKKYGDLFNLARTYKSMGTIYEYFGDVNGAVEAYERSIASGKAINDSNLISNAYNPLSGIYLNEGRTQEAMAIIDEAIQMKQMTGDLRGLAFSLYGRGKVFLKMNDYTAAERDLAESIGIHAQMNENLGEAMAVRKLGLLYLQMKDFEKARYMANRVLAISNQYKLILCLVDAHHLLYLISRDEGHIEMSLKHLEEYLLEKDHLVNERSREMIKSFEVVSRLQALEMETHAQRERNQIIERKNQELDSFFHRVSHDLKGPISSLMGIDALLRRELSDENTLNFLDMSISQVHRINKILDELILLTKVTHNDARRQPIDFDKMIDDILSSIDQSGHFDHVRIERVIEKGLEFGAPWVLANTILQNLIENGVKYARIDQQDPYIRISVAVERGLLQIRVADNGIGMIKETCDQVFEMFYRASNHVSGSGLGLYILNRAVEKLGGTVDVESELHIGSTFTVRLPL
jgi:signal transduction histidine kinase